MLAISWATSPVLFVISHTEGGPAANRAGFDFVLIVATDRFPLESPTFLSLRSLWGIETLISATTFYLRETINRQSCVVAALALH